MNTAHPKSFDGDVLAQARFELNAERFAAAVAAKKAQLRAAKWWHRFIPIVSITWRKV